LRSLHTRRHVGEWRVRIDISPRWGIIMPLYRSTAYAIGLPLRLRRLLVLWRPSRVRLLMRTTVHIRRAGSLLMIIAPRTWRPRPVTATRCRGTFMILADSPACPSLPTCLFFIVLVARKRRESGVLWNDLWLAGSFAQSRLFFSLPLFHCTFLRFMWCWLCVTRSTIRLWMSWPFVCTISDISCTSPLTMAIPWVFSVTFSGLALMA
jgi:hypothetical protein